MTVLLKKKLVLASVLVALAVSGCASPPQQNVAAEPLSFCAGIQDLARIIMTGRQNGVARSKMLEITSKMNTYGDVPETLVDMAYAERRSSSELYKNAVIKDFGIQAYDICINR